MTGGNNPIRAARLSNGAHNDDAVDIVLSAERSISMPRGPLVRVNKLHCSIYNA